MTIEEYHREYGRHSGIPDCCIEAFISGETMAVQDPLWHETDVDEPLMYARCQACVDSGRVVTVHRCTMDCPDFPSLLREGEVR